jgi:photosystem II stability/assembly factor-like uncharacterized protein
MHGNVEEWCFDWYGPYEAHEQSDPVGRQGGDFRVSRGGSHNTEVIHLRSANRHGTLPEDRHWLTGFRVVSAEMPKTKPLPQIGPPLNSQNVSPKRHDWKDGPDPATPYFTGPHTYVKVPPNSNGPMFAKHNHDPGLTWCDNGDLLAIWYSGNGERGRELCILASRLRGGARQWDDASPFWDAPDRNDHAPALLNDAQGRLYHFNGLSAAQNYRENLALIMRTSEDNGATWSRARLINPVRGVSSQPIASTFVTDKGYIVLPSDWPWHENGNGTALWISRDRGQTWSTPGGRIAGIHAGVTQLKDGRLMALGRSSNINGRMPKSISSDMGRTWTYQASRFEPIGGGQRLVLLRLKEGPLFMASFARNKSLSDSVGNVRKVRGLFGAVSFDDGQSWPLQKLITPGDPPREIDGGGNTRKFTLSDTSAEPRGYMAGVQTPDGVIHLISSKQYYAFNLAWLKELPKPAVAVGGPGIEQTDVYYAGELGYKEFRIPVLVPTNSGVLLAISEAGRTASDFGDRDLLLRRSTDGGRTWSDVQLLRDEEKSTCGNPTVVVDRRSGPVHMFSTVNGGRVYHNYTDDDGVTWSQFEDITETFEDFKGRFAWTRLATGSGLGIELARGKHKGRFIMTCWMTKDEKKYRSAVVYSDDRGTTWKAGGLSDEAFNTNECSVYERANGTLCLNMRGGGNHPKADRKPCRIVATSNDGGLTWSKSRYDENLIGPECLASTRRYSWPQQGSSRVLFCNPADKQHRMNMTVRVSYDEGDSWTVAKQIFAGPSAYSCLARLNNGDIGLLYERGDRHRYQKMTFARFGVDWLEEPEIPGLAQN